MSGRRTLRLGLAAYGTGWDLDAWRLPEATNLGLRDPSVILDIARVAERGRLDYVFAGSALGSEPDRLNRIFRWDNFVYAGHAAAITRNLGFVMSVNSSFEHPYAVARQLATLDNFNKGRTALNVVFGIDRDGDPVGNYGKNPVPTEETKYARPGVHHGLEPTAVRELGRRSPPGRQGGRHPGAARVLAPDRLPRRTLRRPRPVERPTAGAAPHPDRPGGPLRGVPALRRRLRAAALLTVLRDQPRQGGVPQERVAANGRDPDKFKIIPGITFHLGGTVREARAKFNEINAFQLTQELPAAFSQALGIDRSRVRDSERVLDVVDFDTVGDDALRPLISDRARDAKNDRELLRQILATQIGEDATLRELYHYVQRSRHEQQPAVVGDARTIADWLEENLEEDVLDGVQLFPPYHRGPADLFVDLVVPELQRRGIFRTEYEAPTLQGLLDTDDAH